MADMIAIAVKLSQANAGDYWSDVERWLRNQFAEGQFTNVAWVKDVVDKLPRTPVAYNETSDRAIERSVGAFAGYTTGNDYGINSGGIMDPTGVAGCCNGNCTRTIYYAWENILEYKGGALRINLLLNRASEWVDLHSYIPYEGRIDIKVKRPLQNVSLHSPEWLHAGTPAVRCNINGRSRSITWNDRYIEIGSLKPQDHVIIHFPLPETNSQEVIGDGRYALTLRGDTVVHVEPPGHFDRLYERSSYRQRSAPLRSVTRFISDEPLSW